MRALPRSLRQRIDAAVFKTVFAPALYACGSKVSPPGYVMFLDPRDAKGTGTFLNFHLHGHVVTEAFELALFLDALARNPDSVVIDIGANYGLYTLEVSSKAIGARQVVAIEADRRVFSFLQRSVREGGFDSSVHVINAAICADHGSTCRLMAHERMSSFNMTCATGDERRLPEAYQPAHTVRGVTVDGLREELGLPAQSRFVIKIDIEGGEPLAFAGMRRTLAESDGYLVLFELAPTYLEIRGVDLPAYTEQVFAFGPDAVFEIDERTRSLQRIASPAEMLAVARRCESKGATNLLLARNATLPNV